MMMMIVMVQGEEVPEAFCLLNSPVPVKKFDHRHAGSDE